MARMLSSGTSGWIVFDVNSTRSILSRQNSTAFRTFVRTSAAESTGSSVVTSSGPKTSTRPSAPRAWYALTDHGTGDCQYCSSLMPASEQM
jgi:hypothetical protein